MMKTNYTVGLIALLFLIASCAKDSTPPIDPNACNTENVSFANDIKPIIDSSCSYMGCHVNGTAPGDFTSYEGLLPFLQNDRFNQRVLINNDMPPTYAPEDKPKELESCQLETIQKWMDDGFPNN